ncbi:dihydrolipoyllysine-residue acetyltransferase [Motiliproteus sediminis]|uniref:dihydrolipoyllysine-residue acetyltransferase n=1 Tax=Motiliproteus sediminis TaxID=1468178 RepID=UPI001FE5544E|nr:dihydrolipoyllysine-residue acetyltransferase [Motiliproteus sediminis]
MIRDFILPDIGEGIVECELVEWLIAEGEQIDEDQPVADVMTDKALVQIPAPFAGRVTKLYYRQGDTAKVHAPLFAVETDAAGADEPTHRPDTDRRVTAAETPQAEPVATAATGHADEDFILPDIGEGIVECEVVEWLVAEGDRISEDQPLVELMTDKAVVQIPAHNNGVITKLYHAQGEIAKVHAPLFALRPDDAAATAPQATPAAAKATPAASSGVCSATVTSGRNGKALASPAVRRIAREHQIDIAAVPGSGRDGRVLKEDILRFVGELPGKEESAATVPAQSAASKPAAADAEIRVEPIKGIKAAMARQMVLSTSTIPHFTYGDEVDVTALLALRQQLKPKAEAQGVRLTLMPFIMKALALAVQQFPILNSRVNDDCTEIHYLPHCNIGMAVDSKIGLLVPNIKRVETLSVLEIAAEVQRITEAARSGRVAQEDLSGGTISISNIGALGGTYSVPVINAPEVAIVALGKTQQLPRFDESGQVVARSIMNISWSGDHRVIDGGTIARFSGLWQSYLEDPASMLLDLA